LACRLAAARQALEAEPCWHVSIAEDQ